MQTTLLTHAQTSIVLNLSPSVILEHTETGNIPGKNPKHLALYSKQASRSPQWQNLLNVKRLYNGSKKAAVKVGEYFTQENPWGKGFVAFLEGVSEDVK